VQVHARNGNTSPSAAQADIGGPFGWPYFWSLRPNKTAKALGLAVAPWRFRADEVIE
jgi:hypothetical protein